jgi:hypothetical protein
MELFFCLSGCLMLQVVPRGLVNLLIQQCVMVIIHHLLPSNMNREEQLETQQSFPMVFHLEVHIPEECLPARAEQVKLKGSKPTQLGNQRLIYRINYLPWLMAVTVSGSRR